MVSKLLLMSARPWSGVPRGIFLAQRICVPQKSAIRRASGLIPPSQYDTPFPSKMRLGNVLSKNWEVIPLFLVTMTSMTIMFFSIIWALKNKVDVVYTTHSRDNISHSMDLDHPTCHKLITIKQEYKPWPKMAHALKTMKDVQKKLRLSEQRNCD